MSKTPSYCFYFDELDKVFDALGTKESRWLLEYLYKNNVVKIEDARDAFKMMFPESDFGESLSKLEDGALASGFLNKDEEGMFVTVGITLLGRHVYTYAPLLYFSLEILLEKMVGR